MLKDVIDQQNKEFEEEFFELYRYKPDFSPENDDDWIEVSKEVKAYLKRRDKALLTQLEKEVREQLIRDSGELDSYYFKDIDSKRDVFNYATERVINLIKKYREEK
jgi:hypothetical protein